MRGTPIAARSRNVWLCRALVACTSVFALVLVPALRPALAQTHAWHGKIAFDIPE
ncbi:MAG: hypothetical protein JSS54_06880 [Proteobacteria bacterium]|nr:hypothetical protein [Pseudomonadota bacterium]